MLLRASLRFFAKHLFKLCLSVVGLLGFMVTKLVHVCLVGTLATLLSVCRASALTKHSTTKKKKIQLFLIRPQSAERSAVDG